MDERRRIDAGRLAAALLLAGGIFVALGTAAQVAAQESAPPLGSFRLEPAPEPSATAQGPVVDGIAPPAVITPTPLPSPTPLPTARPVAPVALPSTGVVTPTPTPRAARSVDRSTQRPDQAAQQAPIVADTSARASLEAEQRGPAQTDPPPRVAPSATPATAPAPLPAPGNSTWWAYALAALSLLLAGGALGWWKGRASRRAGASGPAHRQARPAPPARATLPVAPPEQDDRLPLAIALETQNLSITLVNATLAYQLTLTNTGEQPLRSLAVAADLTSAHASLPREAQLAHADAELPLLHEIEQLAAGESRALSGTIRLPLAQVTAIRQGHAALLVPLLRLRIAAPGAALHTTLVIGQTPPRTDAPLLPFRLDHGPRIYRQVLQRRFA